jgi:hypothetical protein
MKTNLDLATKLHYELNLDNFFVANIRKTRVDLLGWYSDQMEKLLFDKGYQVMWSEDYKNFRFESENVTISLIDKPFL